MPIAPALRRALAAAACLSLACALGSAHAWPDRPVRIVVPFTPGGSADTLGRIAAQKLGEALKQPFIVENRPGAGGVIGSELVAKAAPDGYLLGVSGVASHVIAPATSKVPFDPLTDFTHVALFGGPPIVLVASPALGARDLAAFVALAKAQPGALAYGSPGNGTNGHLVAELLQRQAGIRISHTPYKGAAPAMSDLLGGHIASASVTLATAGAHIRAGKVAALAISAAKRLEDYPEVPTFAERGYPELVATTWFGLSGPAGLPAEIVTLLNTEMRRILKLREVREKLRVEGIEPNDLDAKAFAEFVRGEAARWTPTARAAMGRAN
jgi:tripartite-type tricarboxylate transporter receptor subunit TctC